HFYLDNYEASIADFTKGLELDDSNVRAYNNRAVVRFVREEYAEALEDYKKGVELLPTERLLLGGLAITQNALGHIDEAQELWRALLKLDRRYKDAELVGREFLWPRPLIEETRKLIASL